MKRLNQISGDIDIYRLNAGKHISSDIDKMDEKIFNDFIANLKKDNEKKNFWS